MSNLGRANAMIHIRMDPRAAVMMDTLKNITKVFAGQKLLAPIVRRAARKIANEYKARAKMIEVTGNLAGSVAVKTKSYGTGTVVAIAGPKHTGTMGATGDQPSGNHSWLVEFGSNGRRKPGTRGTRRTYVDVHKNVNAKMKRVARLEDSEKFAKRAKGFYFIMSSENEPTRQNRKGSGYPHDFFMAVQPGETYGAMPARGIMQKSIKAKTPEVNTILRKGILAAITKTISK
tara:strand:+ start:1137 stop:1832 length:696 start_codon:yes stop_codon:yes gene_type:complete